MKLKIIECRNKKGIGLKELSKWFMYIENDSNENDQIKNVVSF